MRVADFICITKPWMRPRRLSVYVFVEFVLQARPASVPQYLRVLDVHVSVYVRRRRAVQCGTAAAEVSRVWDEDECDASAIDGARV